jgi:hypothetical protein
MFGPDINTVGRVCRCNKVYESNNITISLSVHHLYDGRRIFLILGKNTHEDIIVKSKKDEIIKHLEMPQVTKTANECAFFPLYFFSS